MAILSGHKKEKEYVADGHGDHTLVSKWTHADTVEMPNGQTLSEFTFDDSKVSQIQSDSGVSGEYNILLSETANSGTTLTERARKTSQLYWHSNAKLLAVYADNKGVGIKNDDILMSGTDNTWDGENTSLKTALAAKGTSNLEIGNTATTAMAGNTEVNNVTQTQSNDNNGNFEMLFSGTADNITRAEGSRKCKYLTYNPSINKLVLGTANNGSIGISASSTGHEIDVKTTENNKVYASASSMGANLTVKSNVAEPHIELTFIDSNVTKQMIIRPNDIRLSNNTWDGNNVSLVSALAAKQGTLTPGTNISIVSGVISATDTTYNDFDGSVHGLVPVPSNGDSAKFLKGDGTWATPTDTTYSDFVGSTHGLVPAVSTQGGKFLKDDGTWDTPATGSSSLATLSDVTLTTPTDGQILKYDYSNSKWINANEVSYSDFAGSTHGLVPAATSGDATKFLQGDGTWATPSSGSSSLSGLSDVTLTSLTDGQVLKYDATSNKWINYTDSGANDAVTQTATSDNNFYEITFSGSTNSNTRTEGVRKNVDFLYASSQRNVVVKSVASSPYTLPTYFAPSYRVIYQPTTDDPVIYSALTADDVVLGGTSNTWDGTNTSLKAAIAAAGQGGGGGTTVIANPSGTATDDLTSIQIGSTIYDIPSGGGSSSGGSNTLLFQGSLTSSTSQIVLSDDYTNYDLLIFRTSRIADNVIYKMDKTFDVLGLEINDYVQDFGWSPDNNYWAYQIANSTTLNRISQGSNFILYEIYGIKMGNGGGATPVELTKAQYDALTSQEKNDPNKIYFITDYNTEPLADRINESAAVNTGVNSIMFSNVATGTDIVHT